MIGRLSGTLDHKTADYVMIDVGGVGYVVFCSDRTLAGLPGPGEPVSLFTDLLVREDLLQLFGFPNLVEKEWHRLLMSVQGIGAKASIAILSALGADGLGRAIALGDWNAVKAAKGVGPKTAQKVVIDLKDKAPGVMALGGSLPQAQGLVVIEPVNPDSSGAQAEALSALINLGYAQGDAASAVAQAAGAEPEATTQALIKAALKSLSPEAR
ncbi:MAG: Holliday junction branch migration protein RuvA [Pseudomonadota bacterium]